MASARKRCWRCSTSRPGLYTATWAIGGGFLLLAPVTGWLRRTAVVIAALGIIGAAFPKASPGQFSTLLFLIWILVAGAVMVRRPRTVSTPAPAMVGAGA